MYKCPIDYYTDNLVFNADKSCWAVFRLQGFNYDYLSTQGKINKLAQLARVFMGIMSYAQILVVPIEQDLKEHFKNLKKRMNENDVLHTTAIQQIEMTEEYLQEKIRRAGLVNDYATYFIIKLSVAAEYESLEKMGDFVQYLIKDPINAINVQMNLDTKDILASKIVSYQKMADKWLDDNNYKMSMQATTPEETQWLFRRMPYRGTGIATKLFYKNVKEESWVPEAEAVMVDKEKIIRPYNRDIVNLFSGSMETDTRKLKVTTGFSTSYQTFLPISWIPEQNDFPGKEWIYALQKENLQAEVCIHIKVIPHKSALHQLDLKKREINSQIKHIEDAHADIPEDLYVSKEYADCMEQELKVDRAPVLESSITICLADEKEEELEKKCSRVKEIYDDMNLIVERPLSDQLKLYMSFIPSVRLLVKDFVLRLTPITLASGMVGVTRELGDRRGGYIGTIGKENKPVFYSPELACLMNMSPAATFFGDLGTGKSFNADILIYLMVLYGGYGLIIDPKGERAHWETELLALRGLISTITLGADDSDKGKLDPYNIYPDRLAEANELALNVLTDLFGIDPKSDEYTAILESQQRMVKQPGVSSMMKLAETMEKMPASDELCKVAQSLARKIRLQRNNGMAGLLIGIGEEAAIRLDNRLNIIQLQNLKMPSPETPKLDYTRDEMLSVILFGQISAFVKKFAMVKRSVPKGVLIDESWAVSATKEGRNMEEFISRMGRSLFTCIIYNGHSTKDLPTEGIKNSITYKFVFRSSNNREEAERLLAYIGLEVTPENMSVIQNLGAGQCLFKDLYNRVGVLQFDPVFQDLFDVFSTTPTEDTPAETMPADTEMEEIEANEEEHRTEEEIVFEEETYSESDLEKYQEEYPEEYFEETPELLSQNDLNLSLDFDFSEDLFKKEVL